MSSLEKSAAAMGVSMAVFLATMMIAPTAIAVPAGKPGSVMTNAEMRDLVCTKGGHWESVGWARCEGAHNFKV